MSNQDLATGAGDKGEALPVLSWPLLSGQGFSLGVGGQERMGHFSLYLILAAVPEFILSPLVRK